MGANTRIEWADHTINWWIGCDKVSPACAHCYAEAMAARFWPGTWGPNAPRFLRAQAAAQEAIRYQRRAESTGRRFRVFCNSMSDFFEDRWDLDDARLLALDVMRRTSELDWLILTKRPKRIVSCLQRAACDAEHPPRHPVLFRWIKDWLDGEPPANVWLGTTVEDQARADLRIPALLRVPAAVRFLSCEPLLGPLSFRWTPYAHQATGETYRQYLERTGHIHQYEALRKLDWVIVGGETGPKARHMDPEWVRTIRHECAEAQVSFFFKQWGKARAGRQLDGVEHHAFPGEVRCACP